MMSELRKAAKVFLAEILYRSGILWLAFRLKHSGRSETCIFGLHRILTDDEACKANSLDGMVMHAEVFSGLLQYLNTKFNIVSMPDFLGANLPRSRRLNCVLTFDDGWE